MGSSVAKTQATEPANTPSPPQQAGLDDLHPEQFLRLCLRGRREPASLQAALVIARENNLDWEAVHRTAQAEGVAPLLYDVAHGQSVLPPQVEQALQRDHKLTTVYNLRRLHELTVLLRHLEKKEIAAIVLKGAALAEVIYHNIALRPMGDLDVLVHRQDVQAAVDVLAGLGYEPEQLTEHGDIFRHWVELGMRKPGDVETLVEIHWNLIISTYYRHKISVDWLWDTARPARIGDVTTLILGPEAQVLHLCAHLLLHHEGQSLLRRHDIAEVLYFYEGQIDWDDLLAHARAYDLVLPLQQVLVGVVDQWHAPIPPDVVARIRALRPSRNEAQGADWLEDQYRPVAQQLWTDLSETRGWRARLRLAWEGLFPPPAYMQERYRVSHPLLLPLAYPYRWFRGVRSACRGILDALSR